MFAAFAATSVFAAPDASACGVSIWPFGGGEPSGWLERRVRPTRPLPLEEGDHYVLVASDRLMIPAGVVLEEPSLSTAANAAAQRDLAASVRALMSVLAPQLPTAVWSGGDALP